MERKIIRKITSEIYENSFHTQTQQTGIYETDLKGNSIEDPFKNCKTMWDVRGVLLTTDIGRKYLNSAFCTYDGKSSPEFILIKINKRGVSLKQHISHYEFITSELPK